MTADRYIAHARKYGVDGCWQTASCDLAPTELPELAAELAAIAKQRREPFKLSREELARLTSFELPNHARPDENGQQPQAIIRNENGTMDDSPSRSSVTDKRRCEGCSARLPTTLRADSRYCSSACRQRAYRNRKARALSAAPER